MAYNPDAVSMISVGHGLAYPVGVICKVLFVQMIPRMLHANMDHERELIASNKRIESKVLTLKRLDSLGLMPFSAAIFMGCCLDLFIFRCREKVTLLLAQQGGH